jgi:hypothetical protein
VILMADEVGFMMTPNVKKTWAQVAQTPVVAYRNRRHQKVSVLGAVVLHATTGQTELLCDFRPDTYVRGEQASAFLHRVLAEYPDKTTLCRGQYFASPARTWPTMIVSLSWRTTGLIVRHLLRVPIRKLSQLTPVRLFLRLR